MRLVSEEKGCRELWEECRKDVPNCGISDSFSFRAALDCVHGMRCHFIVDTVLEPRIIVPLSRSLETGQFDWFGTSAVEDNYFRCSQQSIRDDIVKITGMDLILDKVNERELKLMNHSMEWQQNPRGTKVIIPLATPPNLAGSQHWSAYNLARARRYCEEAGVEWEVIDSTNIDLQTIADESARYFGATNRSSKFSREDIRRRYALLFAKAVEEVEVRTLQCMIAGTRAATIIALLHNGISTITDIILNLEHPNKKIRDYAFRYSFCETVEMAHKQWDCQYVDGQGGHYGWKNQVAPELQLRQYTLLFPTSS